MKYVAVIANAHQGEDGSISYKEYRMRYFNTSEAMGKEMDRLISLISDQIEKPELYKDYFMLMSKKPIDDVALDQAIKKMKPDLGRIKIMIEVLDGSHPVSSTDESAEVGKS